MYRALTAASRARGRREGWLAVALTASAAATPLLWPHTLILYFPAILMAASLARGRWPTRGERYGAWVEPAFEKETVPPSRVPPIFALSAFVALGCAVVLFYNAGAIDMLPVALKVLLLAVPNATLVLIAAYVVRCSDQPAPPRREEPALPRRPPGLSQSGQGKKDTASTVSDRNT